MEHTRSPITSIDLSNDAAGMHPAEFLKKRLDQIHARFVRLVAFVFDANLLAGQNNSNVVITDCLLQRVKDWFQSFCSDSSGGVFDPLDDVSADPLVGRLYVSSLDVRCEMLVDRRLSSVELCSDFIAT